MRIKTFTAILRPILRLVQARCRLGAIQTTTIILFAIYLSGCASGPKELGPLFYPSLPNPPRIQHLQTISNANDLKGTGGNLAAFILGGSVNDSSLAKPYGVTVHDSKIYVTDTGNSGYGVFDLKEKEFQFKMGSGNGGMNKPIHIKIDKNGTKYVADAGRNQVLVFDRDDNYLRAYGVKDQFKPTDVAMDEDHIYVSDIKGAKIHVLDKKTGETLLTFPPEEHDAAANLAHPTNITLHDGYIYVADSTAARVNKYTTSGEYVMTFGSMGIKAGQLARPKGVAVDKAGNLYVVDSAFDNVQIFSEDGRLLLFFGQPGGERRFINLPAGLALDYDDNDYYQQFAEPGFKIEYVILVVSQYGNGLINVFGFGKMEGMDYSAAAAEAAAAAETAPD